MSLISLFSLKDTINHSAGNEFLVMTYAVEPVGDEIMNDGILLMPKCLQNVIPDSKNTFNSLAPNFLTLMTKLYREK